MEYGHVVLANSKQEFVAKIIKWFTASNWSHSLVTSSPQIGREMGLEAAGNGVSEVLFDLAYRKNSGQGYRVYRVNLPQETKDAGLAAVLPDLETPYGYLDLPWFAWRALNRMVGKDIKAQDNWASKREICSQLVVKYLTACGLGDLFKGYGRNAIAPQDLQVIMEANPQLFELIEFKE